MRVRQVPPAEEPAESAAKKRQCYRRHRSKERDECATSSHGRLAWKRIRSQSEGLMGRNLAVFSKEYCRTHRPNANDRERCKGERQCVEDTDRRKERRESRNCQET